MFDAGAVARSFGKAATEYDRHAHLQKRVRQHCLSTALPYWPDNGSILDLGCGTGALADEVAKIKPGIHLTGLDVSAGMCRQSAAKGLSVVCAASETIPFAPTSFDGILSSLMLQWVDRPSLVFAEINRLLVPGGTAVISTLTHGTLKELKEAFAILDNTPHISDFLVPHTILHCAEEAGLMLRSAQQQTITEYYPDTIALMRGLKAIGASNKHKERGRGMMTPVKIARMEQYYQSRYGCNQGLQVSWQVFIVVLMKGRP